MSDRVSGFENTNHLFLPLWSPGGRFIWARLVCETLLQSMSTARLGSLVHIGPRSFTYVLILGRRVRGKIGNQRKVFLCSSGEAQVSSHFKFQFALHLLTFH